MSQPLFQNIFILRKPKVADFADIIKMATMFTKTTFKKKQKKNNKKKQQKLCIKMQSIFVLLDITKVADFW